MAAHPIERVSVCVNSQHSSPHAHELPPLHFAAPKSKKPCCLLSRRGVHCLRSHVTCKSSQSHIPLCEPAPSMPPAPCTLLSRPKRVGKPRCAPRRSKALLMAQVPRLLLLSPYSLSATSTHTATASSGPYRCSAQGQHCRSGSSGQSLSTPCPCPLPSAQPLRLGVSMHGSARRAFGHVTPRLRGAAGSPSTAPPRPASARLA